MLVKSLCLLSDMNWRTNGELNGSCKTLLKTAHKLSSEMKEMKSPAFGYFKILITTFRLLCAKHLYKQLLRNKLITLRVVKEGIESSFS